MVKLDKKLLIKIAYYYYELGLTQDEIAKKLSMSRQRVNRLAKKLIEEGIVKITINGYEDYNVDIESELEEKFGLKQAIVVPNLEGADIIHSLGVAGAKYLDDAIEDDMTIGVSWGSTLSALSNNIQSNNKKNVSIVQLVGGMNLGDSSIKADEITRTIASRIGAKSNLMYAPAFVRDMSVKDAFLSDQIIKNVFDKFAKCDIAVVGIGSLNKGSTLFTQKYLDENDYAELEATHAVGDICSRYFDLKGKPVMTGTNSRVMGIRLEELKSIGHVVGIAGGKDKVEAIYGALKGKYLNVLITDSATAQGILSLV